MTGVKADAIMQVSGTIARKSRAVLAALYASFKCSIQLVPQADNFEQDFCCLRSNSVNGAGRPLYQRHQDGGRCQVIGSRFECRAVVVVGHPPCPASATGTVTLGLH